MTAALSLQAKSTIVPAYGSDRTDVLRRKCACGGTAGPTGECAECRRRRTLGEGSSSIQPKLRVNRPGDRFEKEADRVAERVMRMPEARLRRPFPPEQERRWQANAPAGPTSPLLQRQDEEEKEEEDELLQAEPTGRSHPEAGEGTPPPIVHDVLRSPGRPLDASTRSSMEPRFGHNFGRVRIHTDARAAAAARAVQARAFTVGRDVVFGAGQYAPATLAGRGLLAHELTHVLQQQRSGGRLQRAVEKSPCAVHVYDASDPKDTAVIPDDKSGIGVSSVTDMVSRVNSYVGDEKNACSCVARLEINGHGTDGYQSVGNGSKYVNDDKALVHDSKEEHLKQLAKIKFCPTGLFMMLGCHVGRTKGKVLQSRIANILPGKLVGGSQHFTAGKGLGQKKVAPAGDVINKDGTLNMSKADPFLTSPHVRWHIVIAGKEYVINGDETTSKEGKAKLKEADRIKVKTPEGETVIK